MDEIAVDLRIHAILTQSTKQNHRSLFILKNSNFRQNVSILYGLLSQKTAFLPTILWCFSKNEKIKNDKQKKTKEKLAINPDFIKKINFTEIDIILGNTVEMLVLEHFKFLSPNILAKAIETVQGGGMIVILLDDTQHKNFNYRLVQSFVESNHICILDENLKICGKNDISSWKTEKIKKEELKFKNNLCITNDQDNVVSRIKEILKNRNNKNIALIKASRGRGKSAALGLSVSNAIEQNYSNIHVIAPHIENVKMLFDFIIKGLNEKGYKENQDYQIRKIFKKRSYIDRIIVNKHFRQVIQYYGFLDQINRYPDLLVIDEAAAIPIPILKNLLRCNLVLMASTCDGYEGTGRSLTMKFVNSLKQNDTENPYFYTEMELKESIRYSMYDPVENWLNEILILKSKDHKNKFCPSPDKCDLFYVNKQVLFSYHAISEKFLKELISIFVTSHYKNTPDDIKILSDEPNHHMFVLLSPQIEKKLPRIVCAVHIAFEGDITGNSKEGNLIPWTISEQFLIKIFLKEKGIRIVRIAVHPDYQSMGYGTKLVKLLIDLFESGENKQFEISEKQSLLISLKELNIPKIDWIGVSMGLNQKILKFWSKNNFFPFYIKQTKNFCTGDYTCMLLRNVHKNYNFLYQIFRKRFLTLSNFLWKEFSVEMSLMLIKFNQIVKLTKNGENETESDVTKINYENSKRLENLCENNIKIDSNNFQYNQDNPRLNNNLPNNEKLEIIQFDEFDFQRLRTFATGHSPFNIIYDIIPRISQDYFHNYKNYLTIAQESVLFAIGVQFKNTREIADKLGISRDNADVILKKVIIHFLHHFQQFDEKR